jgi:hypothetical protein
MQMDNRITVIILQVIYNLPAQKWPPVLSKRAGYKELELC